MTKRTISANLKYETVQEILNFKEKRGIKHFSDAVEEYISWLRDYAFAAEMK